jgi:LPXTG-motif cell wall-anchored protein
MSRVIHQRPSEGTPIPGENGASAEDRLLAGYGYHQELKRDLGLFSSFALSFSIISVTTGIFANYGSALHAAGPAFIWTWVIVGVGQLLVALVFASLARQIPLSGYAYQWTRELSGSKLGWWAGWMMIVQFMSGMPAVCYALSNYLVSYAGLAVTDRNLIACTVAILVSIALINQFGIRLASRVNDFSVGAEILGTVAIGIALLVIAVLHKTNPPSFLLSHPGQPGGTAYLGALGFSALMSIWTLTGFEGAANLAEETRFPQKDIPVAIVFSLVFSVLIGFLVLAGYTLAIPSLAVAQQQPAPLLYIMEAHLFSYVVTGVMVCAFVAIYAAALANLTALTRMVWAMARDRQLPASQWLGKINRQKVPANAIWIVTGLAAVFACWAKVETLMTGISSQAGYLTYAIVVGAATWGGIQRKRQAGAGRTFRISRPLAAAALMWLVLVIVLLSLPQTGQLPWMTLMAMGCAMVVGLILFYFRRDDLGRNTLPK